MSSKNIYVAGASSEIDKVEGYMYRLRQKNWRITHDWVQVVRRVRSGILPHGLSDLMEYAIDDLQGVSESNVVWILMPDDNKSSIGCWVELGYALATHQHIVDDMRIFVSGNRDPSNIFALLAHKIYKTHEEALQAIVSGK